MLTVNRADLSKELSILSAVAERKTTIDILAFVKMEAVDRKLTLTASDIDSTLVTTIDCEGEFSACVPLRPLTQLVRLFNTPIITFEVKDTRVEIKSGAARHRLPYESIAKYQETPKIEGSGLVVNGAILAEMVRSTSFWLLPASDGLRPNELKFVGLSIRSDGKALEVMGTKKTCTAVAEYPITGEKVKAIVFPSAANALKTLGDEIEIVTTANHAVFRSEHRTLIVRQIEGEFPMWREFVPKSKVSVSLPEYATEAIKRTAVTVDRYAGIKLTFQKEFMTIESADTHLGKSEEKVNYESSLNGESIAFGLLSNQILEALSVSNYNVSVGLTHSREPMVLRPTTKDFELTYIITPMDLKW